MARVGRPCRGPAAGTLWEAGEIVSTEAQEKGRALFKSYEMPPSIKSRVV